ncbi:MAG: UDP-N-acetylmuramoyl-L-alanyl-D-glutamate--2,6-diaminopimelate ligase [Acidobacteria bacterium]|nr:UDP-N-acetylmuramoyl-L-alanyl-D-glutamate--2,6-diaminopimelate ligase [Acidobacteriota bacterium]MBI3657796.1 UDP-N-acetylmuramoyl-L-alanyl-D-glutamate--2,6-diaminopimelate ligase [Acidobacteriota bacterium]
MILGTILSAIKQRYTHTGSPSQPVTAVVYDSRRVIPGSLFVAMKGEQTDGHLYVRQAIANGATAILSERAPIDNDVAWVSVADARKALAQVSAAFYHDPTARMEMVGITGTNGKTTTAYLVDSVLRVGGEKVCLVGTINARIGDEDIRPAERTTPEAPDLLALLDQACARGCRYGVMEVSSHALDRSRVYGFRFRVAVFTNLTRDHLDYHGDFESYFQAKRRLFVNETGVAPDLCVINIDDPWGRRLAAELPAAVTYGLSDLAAVHAVSYTYDVKHIRVEVGIAGRSLEIESTLPGKANVYNILATVATCAGLKLSDQTIQHGIAALPCVPGRVERICEGQPFELLVDYAHTDDALRNLLELMKDCTTGRIITVFGCGGDRDRSKRPLMGEVAGRYSDLTVATSDNPRREDPYEILKEIEPGLKASGGAYILIADRRAAIRHAITQAQPTDVVVVAGKGHETTQTVGHQAIPFDDRLVARELLQEWLAGRR